MLIRYILLREHLKILGIEDLDNLFHFENENEEVDYLFIRLKEMKLINIKLQLHDVLISQFRKLFDIAINHFSSAQTRFVNNSDIIKNAVFESALIKLQLNEPSDLTSEKR